MSTPQRARSEALMRVLTVGVPGVLAAGFVLLALLSYVMSLPDLNQPAVDRTGMTVAGAMLVAGLLLLALAYHNERET